MPKSGWLALIVIVVCLGGVLYLVSNHRLRRNESSNWRELITAETAGYKTVLEGSTLVVVPSEFGLRVEVTGPTGDVTHEEQFSGGWRIDVTDAALSARAEAGSGVIEIRCA